MEGPIAALQQAPVRVGVVGLGYFGSRHLRHFAAQKGARLVAVVDADRERASAAAARHGVEAFGEHRALIGKVDAVSIVVPTTFHHAVAGDFIDAGVHVLIEKPIAADTGAAADLVMRAARAGTVLQVGHIERFSPAFTALRERVRSPVLIECVRRTVWSGRAADVDVVLDLMIHDIDLALTLAGSQVVSVAASGASVMTPLNDVAEARIGFASGAVATLTASRVAPAGERKLYVSEPGQHFLADFSAPSLTRLARAGEDDPGGAIPIAPADNLATEIAAFLDCVATGTPPLVDGKAGLDALAVADRILTAIAAGRGRPSGKTQ